MAEDLLTRLPALRDLRRLLDAGDTVRANAEGGAIEFELERLVPMAKLETAYIDHVLRAVEGNKTHAAEILDVDTSTLYRKLKKWAD